MPTATVENLKSKIMAELPDELLKNLGPYNTKETHEAFNSTLAKYLPKLYAQGIGGRAILDDIGDSVNWRQRTDCMWNDYDRLQQVKVTVDAAKEVRKALKDAEKELERAGFDVGRATQRKAEATQALSHAKSAVTQLERAEKDHKRLAWLDK